MPFHCRLSSFFVLVLWSMLMFHPLSSNPSTQQSCEFGWNRVLTLRANQNHFLVQRQRWRKRQGRAGKQNGGKGKREGERVVTISNNTDPRQQRANDRRSEVKHKMLSTVLPKIADLSVEGSDTDGWHDAILDQPQSPKNNTSSEPQLKSTRAHSGPRVKWSTEHPLHPCWRWARWQTSSEPSGSPFASLSSIPHHWAVCCTRSEPCALQKQTANKWTNRHSETNCPNIYLRSTNGKSEPCALQKQTANKWTNTQKQTARIQNCALRAANQSRVLCRNKLPTNERILRNKLPKYRIVLYEQQIRAVGSAEINCQQMNRYSETNCPNTELCSTSSKSEPCALQKHTANKWTNTQKQTAQIQICALRTAIQSCRLCRKALPTNEQMVRVECRHQTGAQCAQLIIRCKPIQLWKEVRQSGRGIGNRAGQTVASGLLWSALVGPGTQTVASEPFCLTSVGPGIQRAWVTNAWITARHTNEWITAGHTNAWIAVGHTNAWITAGHTNEWITAGHTGQCVDNSGAHQRHVIHRCLAEPTCTDTNRNKLFKQFTEPNK